MARRETILDLLDRLSPQVAAAFEASVQNIRSDVRLRALEDALRRQDVAAVLEVLGLEDAYFAPLDRALREAYAQGGDWAMAEFVRMAARQGANTVRARFGSRNPRAEEWLRQQSSRLIVEITEDQRQTVREAIERSLSRGDGPRTTALDLVGRTNRATGQREGGIVGLTNQQSRWADNALDELLSGDPARMARYLKRKARDRRFDRTVARAIREGRPVPASDARRIVARYRQRLLKVRGDTIARTEVLQSLHEAQNEGLRQLVDSGKVDQDAVEMEWDAASDSATRDSHRAMDGQRRRLGEPFQSGLGSLMQYPGDTSLGAPAEDVISCRCRTVPVVDFVKGLRDRLSPEELARARELM